MKEVRITARAVSPLLINETRQSFNTVSLDYIPGSTLRGALAATYLRKGAASDPEFRSIFMGDAAIPNLLPSNAPDTLPEVFPMSAYSCKRNPGFRKEDSTFHGVKDMLSVQAKGGFLRLWRPMKYGNAVSTRAALRNLSHFPDTGTET